MPNIKSAKKRVLVAERNRLRNMAVKSSIKTATKRVLEAVSTSEQDKIKSSLSKVFSLIDKAALRGILHKNTAARKKANIMKHVNQAVNA